MTQGSTCTARRLAIALLAVSAACSSDYISTPIQVSNNHKDALQLRAAMKTRTADFDQLSAEVEAPGFGGAFIDSGGNLRAWMRDESNAPAVRQALKDLGPSRMPLFDDLGRERNVIVQRGDFAFSDLVQWKAALFQNAQPSHGVREVDADEASNRVGVGIASREHERLVRRLASDLGIPQNALRLTVMPQALGNTRTALDGWANPKLAGMMITYKVGFTTYQCSEGFTVTRSGVSYFLTAGHCTDSYTGVGTRKFFQPYAPDTVGTEYENPAWATTGCAPGATYCNTVDVAMIKFKTGVSSQKTVIETAVIGSGDNAGDRWINGIYWVTGDQDGFSGQWVTKTGNGAGTTTGPITQTCVDLPAYENPSRSLSCQHKVQLVVQAGDSGGPVFAYAGSNRLASGIVHTTVYTDHWYGYYSPMSAIHVVFPSISAY